MQPLYGDEAYREAVRIRFEAQKEALEMRLKQELAASKSSTSKKKGYNDSTLSLILNLANVHRDFGKYPEERKHLEDLLEAAIDLKGKEHASTIMATTRLAICLGHLGELETRVKLLESLRDLLPKVYPDPGDALQIVNVLTQLADAYESVGRYDEQIDVLTKAVLLQDSAIGIDTVYTAQIVNKLACAYTNIDAHAKVVEMMENRLPPLIAALGPKQAYVCVAWMHLATAYGNMGRRDDQLGLYDVLHETVEEAFGTDEHPMALIMRRNRAVANIVAQRNVDDCLKELKSVAHSMVGIIGPHDTETFMAIHALADANARHGKHAEATKAYDELLARLIAANGGNVEGIRGVAELQAERDKVAKLAADIAIP
jgi:tetratricopeptide (TPR) repeat protein